MCIWVRNTIISFPDSKDRSVDRLELTPSESFLLLDIEKKDGKTLMKYSLVNLLYKRTLSSEVRDVTEGTVFKKVVKKTYVSKCSIS